MKFPGVDDMNAALALKDLGFETIILPAVSMPSIGKVEGIRLLPAANLREALKYL